MCIASCTFSAVLLGILYLLFEALPLVFGNNNDFSLQQVGLTLLGLLVGMLMGMATDPWWDRRYLRLVAKSSTFPPPPEYRLLPAMAGGILVPLGIFFFGWTTYRSVHWILPIIGSAIFGTGMLLSFAGVWTFLVDAYPAYSASALAANSFLRSSFAVGFPLFATQSWFSLTFGGREGVLIPIDVAYHKLGSQWASSLLAFIALACTPFPQVYLLPVVSLCWWLIASYFIRTEVGCKREVALQRMISSAVQS